MSVYDETQSESASDIRTPDEFIFRVNIERDATYLSLSSLGSVTILSRTMSDDTQSFLDPLGLSVDFIDGSTGIVSEVYQRGLVAKHNMHNPHIAVQASDRILSVNGVQGDAVLIAEELISGTDLSMQILRPSDEMKVDILKDGSPMGLDLNYVFNGNSLLILHVNDGLVNDWNASQGDDTRVKARDRITEVNGIRGVPAQLLDAVQYARKDVSLKILQFPKLKAVQLAGGSLRRAWGEKLIYKEI